MLVARLRRAHRPSDVVTVRSARKTGEKNHPWLE